MDLWEALTRKDARSRQGLHCWTGERFEFATWAEVVGDAAGITRGLRRAGVRPGTFVASVLTNGPWTVRCLLGAWLAGGAVASLPVPARGMSLDEYGRLLATICDGLEPAALLVEERMLGIVPERVRDRVAVRSWESLAGSGRVEASPGSDDDVVFVQYSSGSTNAPKGCMLTPRAIAAQLEMVITMIEGRAGEEVVVSWLPLSHDMGIFGCLLTPWCFDFELYLSTPERFIFAPRTWFGDVAAHQATITTGTNTALYLGARAYRSARAADRLRLRTVIIGAERVEWSTLRLAADAVGLADGVVEEVDPAGGSAARIVSAGVPCTGVELVGAPTSRLDEIRARTPSLASGYFGDHRLTRERFPEGRLLTRDLGFVRDGHLYPVGRVDDVIAIAGRKVYAREIESAVETLAGVRPGCSTLVERSNGAGPRLTLLMELRAGCEDFDRLAREAATLATSKAAVALDECVFLKRGTLPKTPTGKIQRYRCRQLLEHERLEPLASIEMAGL